MIHAGFELGKDPKKDLKKKKKKNLSETKKKACIRRKLFLVLQINVHVSLLYTQWLVKRLSNARNLICALSYINDMYIFLFTFPAYHIHFRVYLCLLLLSLTQFGCQLIPSMKQVRILCISLFIPVLLSICLCLLVDFVFFFSFTLTEKFDCSITFTPNINLVLSLISAVTMLVKLW